MRLKAWHPDSGNTMTGEATQVVGEAPSRSFRVIPDGLLESVIIREGVWTVVLDEDLPACRHCGYFIQRQVPKAPAEPFWAHTACSPTPPAGPPCDHAEPKS